ncbi:MAG TPA: hypothetical protein V6C89_02850 [Drouetiella sp.]
MSELLTRFNKVDEHQLGPAPCDVSGAGNDRLTALRETLPGNL